MKLADLVEKNTDLLAAVESLDNGKAFSIAKGDVGMVAGCLRYYGGWADKIEGKVIDTNPDTFSYTRQESVSISKFNFGHSLTFSFRSVFVVKSFHGTFHCSCGPGRSVQRLPLETPLYLRPLNKLLSLGS